MSNEINIKDIKRTVSLTPKQQIELMTRLCTDSDLQTGQTLLALAFELGASHRPDGFKQKVCWLCR